MSTDRDQYIDSLYDQHLREASGAVAISDLVDKCAIEVESYIAHEERDIPAEARAATRARFEHLRRRRSKSLRKDLAYLLDFQENPEDAAQSVAPLLDQGYKVGDGTDKTLRYWTDEDLNTAVVTRYRESAAAVEAAKDFDETAQRARDALRARGADQLGQILNEEN